MSLNLTEWKTNLISEEREDIKQRLHEGEVVDEAKYLSEEQLEEVKLEVEVEMFCEDVEFEDVFEFDDMLEEDVSGEHDPVEYYDFVPEELGEEMDVTLEFDLTEENPSHVHLNAIKEKLFAEDYEVVQEAERAQVIYKRAKGKITKKKKCGKGFRLVGNRCLPQTGSQRSKLRRKGIKLKRAKRAMGGGAKKRAAIRSKITKRRVKGRNRNYSNTIN